MTTYFFDLDGTLTDSRPGLYVSFQAALEAIGIELDDSRLLEFLGTPLPEMFRTLRSDISQSEIEIGIRAFRSTYERVGIQRNELYPGVRRMMEAIVLQGRTSWVVTSKPEFYAVQIVELLRLRELVSGVIGAGSDENDTKTDLIGRALALADVAPTDVLMVGDRHYDVVGALANDVMPVGVLWGYGTREELSAAGCRDFVESAAEFQSVFVQSATKKPTAYRSHAHGRKVA